MAVGSPVVPRRQLLINAGAGSPLVPRRNRGGANAERHRPEAQEDGSGEEGTDTPGPRVLVVYAIAFLSHMGVAAAWPLFAPMVTGYECGKAGLQPNSKACLENEDVQAEATEYISYLLLCLSKGRRIIADCPKPVAAPPSLLLVIHPRQVALLLFCVFFR